MKKFICVKKKRKQEMIDKMGGKCSMCEFHHVEPSTKEFGNEEYR
jgi:hypothetical protein